MATTLTWLGHAAFSIDVAGTHVLVDPYLAENPMASARPEALPADFILVSHGHGDHVGDALAIAKRTGAMIISNAEIAGWFSKKGVKTHAQHLGGGHRHPFGYLKLTPALHGSGLPDGAYGGNPAGFLLTLPEGKRIYLACDTGLFGDMALIGDEGIEVAALPIGDNFTMGPEDALRAVKLIRPARVIPIHYNTWGLIAQDPDAWAARVKAETQSIPRVLKPGESLAV